MKNQAKCLLAVLLGLTVIFGSSGFSFIVHQCFKAENTILRIPAQITTPCCNHSVPVADLAHEITCCTEKNEGDRQQSKTEIKIKCCTDNFLIIESLPGFIKSDFSERFVAQTNPFDLNVLYSINNNPIRQNLNFYSFTKPSGKNILIFHQSLLL